MKELNDAFMASMIARHTKSYNTIISYGRDVSKYLASVEKMGIKKINQTDNMTVITYLLQLENEGKSSATISRTLASIRAFYGYLISVGMDVSDPTLNLESPSTIKKEPNFLTTEETELLLMQPNTNEPKGIRDKAMLELLYATGIKVSELIEIKTNNINIKNGFLKCSNKTHERIVPIGKTALTAIRAYVEIARPKLTLTDDMDYLFLNRDGHKLTRQGFWKIIKGYGRSAGIEKKINPYAIRHSFAMHLLENGADLEAVRQLLGHTDISVTQVYSKMMDGRIKKVYERSHPRA